MNKKFTAIVVKSAFAIMLVAGAPYMAMADDHGFGQNINEPDGLIVGNTDEAISNRVEWALQGLGDLSISTSDRAVTILGTVPNEEVAKDAMVKAMQVDGVKTVISEMRTSDGSVIPTLSASDPRFTDSEADRALTTKIVGQLPDYPNVVVLSDGGKVILRGTVRSQQEMEHVVRTARTTSGVDLVINELRFDNTIPTPARPVRVQQ